MKARALTTGLAAGRSTPAEQCAVTDPTPYTPTWNTVTDFLARHLR